MDNLSLRKNPFVVLGVSPRAKISDIEDAFEDALVAHPDDELALLKIKQLLLTPNTRLIAELSWLSEVAPRRAEQLVSMLSKADDTGLLAALPDLPPLSAANLAADAASCLRDTRFIRPLIEAHSRINRDSTLNWVNSTRAMAGFARVEGVQVDDAVRYLRTAHARAAVSSLVGQNSPAQALASLIDPNSDPHEPMLKEIFREYDQWSSPHLGEIERDINAALEDLLAGRDGAVDRVNERLSAWDDLSQPAQLYCQLSGLDEERSLRIYRLVRRHCVNLANDHQRFDDAHAVAAVMHELFKELPTAVSELGVDVDTLARLSIEQRVQNILEPLVAALDDAQANICEVIEELKANGFCNGSGRYVVAIYKAFIQTSKDLAGGEHADSPTKLVRSFALDLNNDHDDSAASAILLTGLLRARQPVTETLSDQLAIDIQITENNRDHHLLTQAIDQKNFGEASRILENMIARTPGGEEGARLRTLQVAFKERQTRLYLKWGGWAAAGLFVIYLMMSADGGTSPSTYTPQPAPAVEPVPSVTATPDTVTAQPSPLDAASDQPLVAADISTDVTQPPVGIGLELDANQLRYCTFEKARLTVLKDMVSDTNATAIDGFNSRVDDFNSRCGNYRYHAADLDAAKALAERDSERLTSEARTIAESWNQ